MIILFLLLCFDQYMHYILIYFIHGKDSNFFKIILQNINIFVNTFERSNLKIRTNIKVNIQKYQLKLIYY